MISQNINSDTKQSNYIVSKFVPITVNALDRNKIKKFIVTTNELETINNQFQNLKHKIKPSNINKFNAGISLTTLSIFCIIIWCIYKKI